MMQDLLVKLDFDLSDSLEAIAYYKKYPGFTLWVALGVRQEWVSCLTIGKLEISIPLHVNEMWVAKFDEEHKR